MIIYVYIMHFNNNTIIVIMYIKILVFAHIDIIGARIYYSEYLYYFLLESFII